MPEQNRTPGTGTGETYRTRNAPQQRYEEVDEGVFYDHSTGQFVEAVPKGTSTTDAEGNRFTSTTTTYKAFDAATQKRLSARYGTGGFDSGSGGQRLASDDPRYWDLQYQKLYQDGVNMGLDAESARRQALASLITNRNNTAVDVANTSNDIAKTAAQFAANPRDAVAELMYRNQVGGSTPFGDMTNDNFGEYGKALAAKAESIFSPVQRDVQQARVYRDSIPPVDFYGPEQRDAIGLPPTPAQALTGAGAPAPTTAINDPWAALRGYTPEQNTEFVNAFGPASAAKGGTFNFDKMYASRSQQGASPSSSEGGTNLNIHERALIVGESGQIYATLGEKRPDGSIRAEQLQVKPLKSEVEKDKKLEEGKKAIVETQKQTLASFEGGGTVNAMPDDFMAQLSQYLSGLGGSGGGTGGYSTALPSARLLAGDPWSSLEEDPDAMAYTEAGYSALGISPKSLQATIKKFTPQSAQRVGQTAVRTNF